MPGFSVAEHLLPKKCLLDKQSNFLKISLPLFSYIKIDNCMLLALP